jgi:hypothetical protein
VSSGSRATMASIGVADSAAVSMRSSVASPPSMTASTGMPASSAPLAPSPSRGAAQTSALAPESSRTYWISSALSSAWTGTATAPRASVPKYVSGKCGVFGSSSATLSPGPTPFSRRTAAYCREWPHSCAYVSRRSPSTTAVRSG